MERFRRHHRRTGYIPGHYNTDKNKTFFFYSEEAQPHRHLYHLQSDRLAHHRNAAKASSLSLCAWQFTGATCSQTRHQYRQHQSVAAPTSRISTASCPFARHPIRSFSRSAMCTTMTSIYSRGSSLQSQVLGLGASLLTTISPPLSRADCLPVDHSQRRHHQHELARAKLRDSWTSHHASEPAQ